MPDQGGRLTDADQEKARQWFAIHWKEPVVCPVCRTDNWTVGDHVVQSARWAQNMFAPPAYPFVMVACNSCHHTLLFNAVPMGIVPVYQEPQPAEPPRVTPPQNLFARPSMTRRNG